MPLEMVGSTLSIVSRDLGPFSTRNSSKGALLLEAHAVFRALRTGIDLSSLRRLCLEGRMLRKSARETRERVWDALHWRHLVWQPRAWVIADLADAATDDGPSRRFIGLVYLHYARRDRLTFEFVTERLWDRWKRHVLDVRREDVLDFLAEHQPDQPGIRRWREGTRKKLAGSVLTALRDFGLLHGTQHKTLRRPLLAHETARHLVRLLHDEGLRGRAILEAEDWRLFLLEPHGVALTLGALAQRGDIRFERSGRTVILELPDAARGRRQ